MSITLRTESKEFQLEFLDLIKKKAPIILLYQEKEQGKKLIIKQIAPTTQPNPLIREAYYLNLCQGSQHVPKLYSGQNSISIAAEYVDHSLADYFTKFKDQSSRLSLSMIAWQMLNALQDLHNKGLLHQDVKPANFRVTDDNIVKVLGYKQMNEYRINGKHKAKGRFGAQGTPQYASINALQGYNLSRRDDIVSLGFTLMELVEPEHVPWKNFKDSKEILLEKRNFIQKGASYVHPSFKIIRQLIVLAHQLKFEEEPKYQAYCDLLLSLDQPFKQQKKVLLKHQPLSTKPQPLASFTFGAHLQSPAANHSKQQSRYRPQKIETSFVREDESKDTLHELPPPRSNTSQKRSQNRREQRDPNLAVNNLQNILESCRAQENFKQTYNNRNSLCMMEDPSFTQSARKESQFQSMIDRGMLPKIIEAQSFDRRPLVQILSPHYESFLDSASGAMRNSRSPFPTSARVSRQLSEDEVMMLDTAILDRNLLYQQQRGQRNWKDFIPSKHSQKSKNFIRLPHTSKHLQQASFISNKAVPVIQIDPQQLMPRKRKPSPLDVAPFYGIPFDCQIWKAAEKGFNPNN
ncbi:hypothetical protein FGO68_gene3080 [Halteria grandinella]|uniref:Casein kinase I n=1 Tax=Halteria grandinella TaxID=5974 RepID=A0A8J8T3Y2_HALGN|nr:hypothetical protein FGO68_gene3080 [Halteria grandinella]